MTWSWTKQLNEIEQELDAANLKLDAILSILKKTPTKLEVKLGPAVKR